MFLPLSGCCSSLSRRASYFGRAGKVSSTMLALLCSFLLLAARASTDMDTDTAEPGSNTAEQIRDMHVKLAPGAKLEAFLDLEGFTAEHNGSARAIHVHQFGDVSQGCEATGPHYNPLGVPHPQHPGDFGNFWVRDGSLWKYRTGLNASLVGPHSIVGRAVVVHAGQDDLGRGGDQASVENGNAGPRLACCVVGVCGPEPWARQAQKHAERKKRWRENECKAA
ncbi:extracellular superoxide dismutase [Cu-Zn] isoform X2 [Elephas maximus indicus]|uniref:extracellular superoxide dismutase [Cu-Zn] isoform X2 n=1 Tax=Elephas maximus indicus TaxID=99487 RepID=UPI002116FC9C|nr:extracellular superoxide dismutase [Cu-Zn] isoform X2 [Elephas maximus indicus]